MIRTLELTTFKGERFGRSATVYIHDCERWNNTVDVIRETVRFALGLGHPWNDHTLIPIENGSNGVWSARDLSERITTVTDREFIK